MLQSQSIRRRLVALTTPIFIETLLVMTLGTVDTIMLSRCSDNAVAAVGVVNQLLTLVFLVFGVSTAGTSVLCSQYLGADQEKNVIQVVGISIVFNTVLGLGLSALLFWQAEPLLGLMDLRVELMPDATVYMRLVGGFAFLQAVSQTLSAVLRSSNMAYYPMQVTFFINVLNVMGNYALIFGHWGFPELGVEGAALSTSFSRAVAMVLLTFILFRKGIKRFPLSWFKPFPTDKLHQLLRIGLPSAGEQISYSLSQVVITYCANMLGNDALAARTYAMNIVMFTYLFSLALGQGGAICVGHLIGRRQPRTAYLLGVYCIRLSIGISVAMAVLTALLGPVVLEFLTANPAIIAMGITVLCIDVLLEGGRAVNILCVNMLRATGDVNYPFWVGVIVMWSVATGLGYVFGITLGLGLAGMWVAFTLDEGIRAVLLGARWKSRKWQAKSFVKTPSHAVQHEQ